MAIRPRDEGPSGSGCPGSPKPTGKPVLYLDVDDTILFAMEDQYVLRPDAEKQILDLCERFDCFWLTNWEQKALGKFLAENAPALLSSVRFCDWSWAKCKAEAVMAGPADFWWLEDPFSPGSTKMLEEKGRLDRFVVVDPFAVEGFSFAIQHLLATVEARPSAGN
jgi:hypothetical protein